MKITLRQLKQIIKEEIGRNLDTRVEELAQLCKDFMIDENAFSEVRKDQEKEIDSLKSRLKEEVLDSLDMNLSRGTDRGNKLLPVAIRGSLDEVLWSVFGELPGYRGKLNALAGKVIEKFA